MIIVRGSLILIPGQMSMRSLSSLLPYNQLDLILVITICDCILP